MRGCEYKTASNFDSTPLTPTPLGKTTSHSTKLQNTAAKSLVIPPAGEGLYLLPIFVITNHSQWQAEDSSADITGMPIDGARPIGFSSISAISRAYSSQLSMPSITPT